MPHMGKIALVNNKELDERLGFFFLIIKISQKEPKVCSDRSLRII